MIDAGSSLHPMRMQALLRLIVSRTLSEKGFLALRVAGLTIAVGIASGVFIYLDGLGQSALNQIIDGHNEADLNVVVRAKLDAPTPSKHQELMTVLEQSRFDQLAKVTDKPVAAVKSATLLFDQDTVPWSNARAFFAGLTGFRDSATLISGAWPETEWSSNEIDVAISVDDAQYLGLTVGDSMKMSAPSAADQRLIVRIAGIYQRADPNSSTWQALDQGLIGNSTTFRFVALVLDEKSIAAVVAEELPETELRYYWIFETNHRHLKARTAEQLLEALDRQDTALRTQVAGFQRVTSLDEALENFIDASTISRGLMLAVGAVIALSALGFSAMVAGQAREIRAGESAMLRARGATAPQEIVLMTSESILIALISLVAGVAVALIGVSLAGRLPGLSELTGGEALPVSLSVQSLSAAVGATVIGFASLLVPSITRNVATMQELTSRLARPAMRNALQRYYLDIALLGLGLAALWQISQEDLFIASSVLGEGFSNRLALAMPAAIAAGGAITLMRFLPFTLSIMADSLSRLPSQLHLSPAVPLALWSLARNPRSSMGIMLLIILAASIAILLAVFSPSINRYSADEARYRVGSDLRISQMVLRSRNDMDSSVKSITGLPEVQKLSTVARVPGTASSPEGTQAISAVGIVPDEFNDAAWWRGDLAGKDLGEMVDAIKDTPSNGLPLPEDAAWITAMIKPDTQRADTGLVVRLRSQDGHYHTITIGNLQPRSFTVDTPFTCPEPDESGDGFLQPQWCRIGFPLERLLDENDADIRFTLDFLGLSRRPIENAPLPTLGSMHIADITTYDSNGVPTLITDFGDILQTRTAGPGLGEHGARIDPINEAGDGGAIMTWSQPDFRQIKGVRMGSPDLTVRVIGSRWFKHELGLEEGDISRIFLGSRGVDAEFVAFTDYFPTFGARSAPYLITDIRKIWEVVSIDNPIGNDLVNEYWIAGDEIDHQTISNVTDILDRNRVSARLFQLSDQEVDRAESDALATLGWNSYLTLGFLAVTLISALAFTVNAWTTYRIRRLELAVLKSMGLTMRQMLIMIGLEQTLIAAIALAIGTAFGFMLSSAMLPYLSGLDASTLAPPMVIEVGWTSLFVLLDAIALCLLSTAAWIFLWARRQHEYTVLRAGGAGA